jgi:hypothetical protein
MPWPIITLFLRQDTSQPRLSGHGGLPTGRIDYARQLNAVSRPQDIAVIEVGTLEDWANESHVHADKHAYRGVRNNARLAGVYFDANEPIVDEQLTRGGVRLAKLLNGLLK